MEQCISDYTNKVAMLLWCVRRMRDTDYRVDFEVICELSKAVSMGAV